MNKQESDTERRWVRNCPKCGKLLNYSGESSKKNRDKHERRGSVCRRCSKLGHVLSEMSRLKISKSRRGQCIGKNNPFYGKKHSIENIRKARMRIIERVRSHGRVYNLKGCKVFDEINKTFGWNGVHGTSGGEFVVHPLGYVVDYYEPTLNIVIEYDEPYHNRLKQKPKDAARQKEITNHLKCRFFRIKEGQNWKDVLNDFSHNTIIP